MANVPQSEGKAILQDSSDGEERRKDKPKGSLFIYLVHILNSTPSCNHDGVELGQ